jgi:hypothetical protein
MRTFFTFKTLIVTAIMRGITGMSIVLLGYCQHSNSKMTGSLQREKTMADRQKEMYPSIFPFNKGSAWTPNSDNPDIRHVCKTCHGVKNLITRVSWQVVTLVVFILLDKTCHLGEKA